MRQFHFEVEIKISYRSHSSFRRYKVRFRVRTIHFTRLTTSFKGVQATTTSEIHNGGAASSSLVKSEAESTGDAFPLHF
jgi:hypothetical protein